MRWFYSWSPSSQGVDTEGLLKFGIPLSGDQIEMDSQHSGSPRLLRKSSSSESEGERKRLLDVEAQVVPLHENADHIRSLYSQHIMSAASASAYGLIGLLMGFVNKAVLMQWPYPNSFLALQMVASIMVVYTIKAWGLATVQPLHMKAARVLLPVVFFYNTNVGFALAAVRALSIPVYHGICPGGTCTCRDEIR